MPKLGDQIVRALHLSDRIKDVAAALAARWEVPRRDVYRRLLAMREDLAGE